MNSFDGVGKGEICRSRQTATLARRGEKARLPPAGSGPRARFPEGRWQRLLLRERGGPSPCPGQGGTCPRLRLRSPQAWGDGKEGCQGHRGTPGWLGGTAPDRVWSAQIPGSGSNLACPVWLSPDTRDPAMKKPRQNNRALARAARQAHGLSRARGGGGAGQEGPRHP